MWLSFKSGKRGSNSRPQPWQGCALPTELFPRLLRKLGIFCCARCVKINFLTRWQRKFRIYYKISVLILVLSEEDETRTHTTQRPLPPQSSASTNSATSPFIYTNHIFTCPEQDSNLHVFQHSHLKRARLPFRHLGIYISMSGKRGSNSRPQPWQGCALPTELFPHLLC